MPNALETLLGGAQLYWDCVGGIVGSVEQMHATIAARSTPFGDAAKNAQAGSGVTGSVYAGLRRAHHAVAEGLAQWSRTGRALSAQAPLQTDDNVGMVSALNAVCGDHLEASGNPLAIDMSLRKLGGPVTWTPEGAAAAYPTASAHLVVWIHGLGMSEQAWNSDRRLAMGAAMERELAVSSVYVRYNSGRRVSINGHELARRLEQMLAVWPVPVESLTLIGHSMGGLLARSAGYYADQEDMAWRGKLRALVCLGTPHHGSPVERGGHLITRAIESSPYSQPLAFARSLSAGIKDLRHGNLIDEDWQHTDGHDSSTDRRTPVPLLAGVKHFFAAATLARAPNDALGYLMGDLLVGTASAMGAHREDHRHLGVPPGNCRVFNDMSHFDLLGHLRVYEHLVEWLRRDRATSVATAPVAPGNL